MKSRFVTSIVRASPYVAGAIVGCLLAPDAYASGIQKVDDVGRIGITALKGIGYLMGVGGIGGAGIGYATNMSRGVVGTAAGVGLGGGVAVAADAAGVTIFGEAPAAGAAVLSYVPGPGADIFRQILLLLGL